MSHPVSAEGLGNTLIYFFNLGTASGLGEGKTTNWNLLNSPYKVDRESHPVWAVNTYIHTFESQALQNLEFCYLSLLELTELIWSINEKKVNER